MQPNLPSPHTPGASNSASVWQLINWLTALAGLLAMTVIGLLTVIVLVGMGDTMAPASPVALTTGPTVKTASVVSVVSSQPASVPDTPPKPDYWHPPGEAQLPAGTADKEIRYGQELIAHTAKYFGPTGSVLHLSNGMNCQNCHLDAGTKVLANNYSAVFSTYPKFRERSGDVETVVKRITDCFERSLNGKSPDAASREMKAMVAYMKWLGMGVPKGDKPKGVGTAKLTYLDRAADPAQGRRLYSAKCQSCHGVTGKGIKVAGDAQYTCPPLWGPDSYNDGAGLFRLSSFAGYVRNNMPYGASYQNALLTDAESWDLAAFINSMPRPHKDQGKDWPKIAAKPVDFPFAPYADSFSEKQHKFGPYQPITDAKEATGIRSGN